VETFAKKIIFLWVGVEGYLTPEGSESGEPLHRVLAEKAV